MADRFRRPVVFVPLLLLAGLLAGYILGMARLAASERQWEARRGELERSAATLESALRQAQGQEVSYRVLVSISRVVVDLYDRNFGLAAEDLRKAWSALESVPQVSGSDLAARFAAFGADLDELSRRIEEMTRTSRDTAREIEREVTRLLFPEGS